MIFGEKRDKRANQLLRHRELSTRRVMRSGSSNDVLISNYSSIDVLIIRVFLILFEY
jgi:hypothetical protein